jgi:ribosomal protein S18 acetylase RimI-like enzyme
MVSSPERLHIAEIEKTPVGFIFVIKEGRMQLDDFGTSEGKWLFAGPTCNSLYEKRAEKELLRWLMTYAQTQGVSTLIKFVRIDSQEYVRELLKREGFHEVQRYYVMQLELTEPPPPRKVPEGLNLVDYKGEEDFDMLWSVLEAAFKYDRETLNDTYERVKNFFGFTEFAYMKICIDTHSQQPVGVIALSERRTAKDIYGVIATLGVIPSFQRKGIGSFLLERALHYSWQSGVKTLELSVRAKNMQALKVYENFGFEVIPHRTRIVLVKNI